MTTMNAKAELENRRLDPSHSNNHNNTMDVAAEALQSLGDNQQQADGGDAAAVKEESAAPPTTTTEKDEGSAEAADSETAEVNPPEGEAPPPPKDAVNGEPQQVDAAKAEDTGKRYLPEHKKPDAAPTFPEKLMKLMRYAEKQGDDFCVAWMEDGKSFIIRKPDEFTRTVVPKFFKATKFSSFTRKLYRWGFRQVNRGIGPDDPIIFGNEFFVRDGAERMAKMRSVTAAATRKEEQKHATTAMLYGTMPMVGHHGMVGGKHPLDMGGFDEATHKRMMIEHMYQHKSGVMAPNPRMSGPGGPGAGAAAGYYPPGPGMAMGPNGAMSLTSALRPGMGMPPHPHGQMMSQQQPGGGGPPPPGMNPGGYDYMGYPGMQPQYHPGHQQHHQQQQQQGHPHPPPQGGGGAPGAMGGPHHHQQQQHQQQQQHPQGPYNMQAGGGGPYHPQQHQGMPPPPQHQQQQQQQQYPPHPQQHHQQQHSQGPHQQQQQAQPQGQGQPPQAQQHPQGNPYPNPAATAEIVNAAIAALRYAN